MGGRVLGEGGAGCVHCLVCTYCVHMHMPQLGDVVALHITFSPPVCILQSIFKCISSPRSCTQPPPNRSSYEFTPSSLQQHCTNLYAVPLQPKVRPQRMRRHVNRVVHRPTQLNEALMGVQCRLRCCNHVPHGRFPGHAPQEAVGKLWQG